MRVDELFDDNELIEDWKKVNRRDKTDGMSSKAVKAYRRENPGSKLQTAVTTKPSKLKKGSKSAKRRKSFCARMKGMKKAHAGAKTKRNPDSPINKALRRWNCESIEEMRNLIVYAEQIIAEEKQRLDPKCWTGYKKQGTKMKGGVRVNNCVPAESIEEENKGLYHNVNQRKKAGISRDKDHPKAPTAQAWKDAAKTAKKEDITESNVAQAVMNKINPVKQWLLDLQKKLSTETGETKTMFDTYVRYTQGQASEQEMAAANEQFKDVLRGLGMGTLAAMPGSVVTLPLVFKLAKQFNVQIVPSAFRTTAEAVNLDRSKNPNYPNDAATQKHRLDTAKKLLSDPKSDPDSRREAATIIARMEPKGKA